MKHLPTPAYFRSSLFWTDLGGGGGGGRRRYSVTDVKIPKYYTACCRVVHAGTRLGGGGVPPNTQLSRQN